MVYYLELVENGIDLNSTNSNPKAKLKIISDPPTKFKCSCTEQIEVSYRAIVTNMINVVERKLCATITNGYFQFVIPQNTTGIEITVNAPNGCNCFTILKLYHPSNCKLDFQANLLSTRLTFITANRTANDFTGFDHGLNPGDQLGPGRSSRAMAIVNIAMFEAVNAIIRKYNSYLNLPIGSSNASKEAAIIQAMNDTLYELFPQQRPKLSSIYNNLMNQIPNGISKTLGINIGKNSALTIWNLRQADPIYDTDQLIGLGPNDYHEGNTAGSWTKDPISNIPMAIGSKWADLIPTFAIANASVYRCPALPSLNSDYYTMSFDEVKSVGGDGINTPTTRSSLETFIGNFWAYDGTPSLCAPPRLYNQIVLQVALQYGIETLDLIRLLALVNIGMADAGISAWESKYYYNFWRPIGGIRDSPASDSNPNTVEDPNWHPLGAPASNTNNVNFTPPFPAYPSGHATFGATIFQILRRFFGKDNVPFTFVSDEYNGITKDNNGMVRPYLPRSYNNFSDAEEENGQSRMYLGIHWNFDKTEGVVMGHKVGNYIFDNVFTKL